MAKKPDDLNKLAATLAPEQQQALDNYMSAYRGLLATQVGPDGPTSELVTYEQALAEFQASFNLQHLQLQELAQQPRRLRPRRYSFGNLPCDSVAYAARVRRGGDGTWRTTGQRG